jgi:hypothetical protein
MGVTIPVSQRVAKACAQPVYPATKWWNNCVMGWNMEEASGDNVASFGSSPKAGTFILNGGSKPTWAGSGGPSRIQPSLDAVTFTNTNKGVISLGTGASVPLTGAPAISILFWVNFSTRHGRLFWFNQAGGSSTFGISVSSNKLKCEGRSGSADGGAQGDVNSVTLSTSTWYSFCGILNFADDEVRTGLNGVFDAPVSVTFANDVYNPTTPVGTDYIGGGLDQNNTTTATMDNVRIFDRVITAAQFTEWNLRA